MRVFLTNLRRGGSAPAHINRLDSVGAADRVRFDRAVGFDSADLTHDEVDRLRPGVYSYLARKAATPFPCKVHDAYTYLPDGKSLFPPEATAAALYLIRNPLDVCVSYAHHLGEHDCDPVIDEMENPQATLLGEDDGLEYAQLRQRLLSWSDHVRSWVDAPNLRLLILRYEDMKTRPVETFTAAAAFLGLTQERAKIERALNFSSLDEMQHQEREHGFQEALVRERPFFRKGKVGSWREVLTEPQVARIVKAHRDVMLRFGYLTATGELVA
jgi:hypothetical protein